MCVCVIGRIQVSVCVCVIGRIQVSDVCVCHVCVSLVGFR